MVSGRDSVLVIGLGGITCSFKSTLAKKVKEIITDEYKNVHVEVVHQDNYFLPLDQVPSAPDVNHFNYECPESMRLDDLTKDMKGLIDRSSVVEENSTESNVKPNEKTVIVLEGFMLFYHEPLRKLFDKCYFLFGTYEECKRIRSSRTDYIPPDVEGYFDAYVWPYAMRYENEARQLADEIKCTLLHMNAFEKNLSTVATDVRKWLDRDWLLLKRDSLDLQQIVQFVTEPSDGAVAVFCGITRDTFEGKTVVQLEYEAYHDMAVSEMRNLCSMLRTKWSDVDRIAIHHRLGVVPVSESSVIIAVSSPHRKEAQAACALALDHLKAYVPIWKKEIYTDGSGTWKENKEWSSLRN